MCFVIQDTPPVVDSSTVVMELICLWCQSHWYPCLEAPIASHFVSLHQSFCHLDVNLSCFYFLEVSMATTADRRLKETTCDCLVSNSLNAFFPVQCIKKFEFLAVLNFGRKTKKEIGALRIAMVFHSVQMEKEDWIVETEIEKTKSVLLSSQIQKTFWHIIVITLRCIILEWA